MHDTAHGGANLPLFVEVLAHIELNPDVWNQENWFEGTRQELPLDKLPEELRSSTMWFDLDHEEVEHLVGRHCGTVACIAGWATLLSGAKPTWQAYIIGDQVAFATNSATVSYEGQMWAASELAEQLLGVRRFDTDGEDLFHGQNTKDDVYTIGANIFGLTPQELRDRVAARVAQLDIKETTHA